MEDFETTIKIDKRRAEKNQQSCFNVERGTSVRPVSY